MEWLSDSHFPIFVGILGVLLMGLIAAVKSYRWMLDEIRRVVTDALESHSAVEEKWQHEVERRLEAIESKLDRLTEK